MLLGWIWRFRRRALAPEQRVVLIGLIVVGTTFALKLDRRPAGPAVHPADRRGRDARWRSCSTPGRAIVTGLVAVIAGAVNTAGRSLELVTYVLLGGLAGILAIRRGDRLQVFVQAGLAVFVVHVARRHDVLAPRRSRPTRRRAAHRAPRSLSAAGVGGRRGRLVRRPRQRLRDPDRVPAAGAREPVPAAAPAAAGRDARHVPPLADGRQPRRARRRGDRRRPADHPRRGLLPRHRQAGEPAGVHREPVRRREHPRRARARGRRPRSSSSTSPTGSTSPTRRGCRSRSSPSSRSTTGRRS